LELARWPVEGAVDLDGAEILGIVVKPGSFPICELYGIETTYPVIVRSAAAAHQDRHSIPNMDERRDLDYPGNTKLYFNKAPIIKGVEVDG
jgi:hypothetical protein